MTAVQPETDVTFYWVLSNSRRVIYTKKEKGGKKKRFSSRVRTQSVAVGRMPHGGWRAESAVSESYAVRIGFHDADRLIAVETGSAVAGRRQHRTGKL